MRIRAGPGFWSGMLVLLLIAFIVVYEAQRSHTVAKYDFDFTLQVIDERGLTGNWLTLKDYLGNVIIIEFMVEWCPYCKRMVPTLKELYAHYSPRGVTLISIAGMYGGANVSKTAKFIEEYSPTWTYVVDEDNEVFKKFKVRSTPTYIIIDRNGEIVKRFEGVTNYESFASVLDKLLG